VDPTKPTLKAPGTKRLNLTCNKLLSSLAFKFNLRRYILAEQAGDVTSLKEKADLLQRAVGVEPREVALEGCFIGDLTAEPLTAFLKSTHLGASVEESWVVMNVATHFWNKHLTLIRSQEYADLLPAAAPLFTELCKLKDCDPNLLGNIAHVVASGYEHLALLAAVNAKEPPAEDEDRLVDYKSLRASLASDSFTGSDDISKAIETCEVGPRG